MKNLYAETERILSENGLTINDVEWVQDGRHNWADNTTEIFEIPIAEFIEWAQDFWFHDDWTDGDEIPSGLMIVGKDWWIEQNEYDSATWLEFKTMPTRPTEVRSIYEESGDEKGDRGWIVMSGNSKQ